MLALQGLILHFFTVHGSLLIRIASEEAIWVALSFSILPYHPLTLDNTPTRVHSESRDPFPRNMAFYMRPESSFARIFRQRSGAVGALRALRTKIPSESARQYHGDSTAFETLPPRTHGLLVRLLPRQEPCSQSIGPDMSKTVGDQEYCFPQQSDTSRFHRRGTRDTAPYSI